MHSRVTVTITTAALICLMPLAALATIVPYNQDFEGLLQPDPSALSNDGWKVYGNVFSPDGSTWLYGYGTFPAPNDGFGFCQIDIGQGGVEQGLQQLSIFSDYNNVDHATGNRIESNVFQEITIDASNVGETWIFEFQHKIGNLELSSTATAFIKTIDPNNNWDMTNFVSADMTTIPDTWDGTSLSLTIDAGLVGQYFQFGFLSNVSNYEGSGVFYDNLVLRLHETAVPDAVAGAKLHQNYPNPFNPSTRISFTTERLGTVDVSVFDLSGRRIATLYQGELDAGDHQLNWNGMTDTGQAAAAGQYRCVLTTETGQLSRSMSLLK